MRQLNRIVVYLDSSDYSVLSNPKRSPEMEGIRKNLLELASLPRVIFAFSGIHISEMAPLEPKFTDLAAARTDIMVQLCGKNTLLSLDRLVKSEIDCLSAKSERPVDALVCDGTWFPDIGEIVTPAQVIDAAKFIDDKGTELGLNRKHRRLLKSKASRHGRFRHKILDNIDGFDFAQILDSYPMRPRDAKILADYVLGKVDAKRAEAAFLESLRDPRWMMRWFHEHHDRLGPVGDWTRAPATKMFIEFSEIIHTGNRLLHFENKAGNRAEIDFLDSARWQARSEEMVCSVVNRLLQSNYPQSSPCDDMATINRNCPGISSLVRTACASLRNSFGSNARRLARSDFVDAMHAMYAPYVQVFRTDRYMTPIVKKNLQTHDAGVIEALERVPSAIQSLI